MTIGAIGRVQPPTQILPTRLAESHGFSVGPDQAQSSPPSPSRTPLASPAASIDVSMMLALQESTTSAVSDREARQHGRHVLAALAEIQRAMLSGMLDHSLTALSDLINAMPSVADAGLRAALASIRLRARIELARRATDTPL